MAELWQGDLQCVPVQGGGEASLPDAARRLEIFLDLLLAEATQNTAHLLDDDFSAVLTEEERLLRDALRRFQEEVPESVRRSPAWHPIAHILERFGRRPWLGRNSRVPRLPAAYFVEAVPSTRRGLPMVPGTAASPSGRPHLLEAARQSSSSVRPFRAVVRRQAGRWVEGEGSAADDG